MRDDPLHCLPADPCPPRILSQCSLPTDYLAKIGKQPPVQSKQTLPKSSGVKNNKTNDYFYSKELFDEFEERIIKSKVELNLTEWLKRNYSVALQKLEAIQPIQDELRRLKDELVEELQLEDLRWNCDWSVSHIRGCLTNLSVLNKQYPDDLNRLQAKTVIFSRHNCIDLNGQVILNIEDVRNSWLDLIRSIKTYDTYLESLPVAEKTLSGRFPLSPLCPLTLCTLADLLRGISIVHPQYNLWSVKKYFKQLRRLIDSVVEYKRQQGLPSNWPRSLGHHRLIVEFDSGPLMLSPCGHFIVPASCPVSLLVRFISENLLKASHSLERDRRCSEEERRVRDECVVAFGLKCLDKDENITAEQMIEFGGRLLGERDQLRPYLLATHLRVSHYYSVLHDGQICVPYNFTP